MKAIMVMTVRLFQIELMYDDLDRSKVIRTVYGQRDTRSSGHSRVMIFHAEWLKWLPRSDGLPSFG